MGQLLETIYGILFQPTIAFKEIGERQPLGQSILVLTAVTLLTTWTGYFAIWSKSIFILGNIIVTLLIWLLGTAVAHLTAELFNGNGRAKSLLAAYGYVQVPRIFSIPLFVIASYVQEPLATGLLIISGLIIFGWEMALRVIAIREVYAFTTGKAVLTFFAPYLLLIACGVILGIVLATGIMQALSHFNSNMMPPFMH